MNIIVHGSFTAMEHIILLLLCVAPLVVCYSSGQVMDSCGDMKPHHSGLSPQAEPAPFTITTDHSSYTLGDMVTVRLQAPASTPFTGFLLQAREVGGESPVGSFTAAGAAQLLTCNQIPNTAVSHTSASVKTSILVTWRMEVSGDIKPIQFHAAFVQNYKTFWVDVKSPVVNFTNHSTGGPTSVYVGSTTTTIKQPAASVQSITNANCGVTKTCFSQPPNCDPQVNADCYFMSTRMSSPNDASIHFEMTGPSDGYISFGFSDDQMMGNDDIYICGMDSNGLVRLQHALSTGRTTPQVIPLGNVSNVRSSVEDGVISCSFTSMNIISTQRTTGFNKTYHLMFAYGPSNNGQIQIHTGTFISSDKLNLSRPWLVRNAGQPHIIKAHGALLLITWMTIASLGMMVARYLKGVTIRQKLCGKEIWFLVHVAVMSVTVTAVIIGFTLSFSYIKAWSGGAHPVLGCLVMILSFLQPMMALLRCGPQHPQRFLFNWSHALIGVSTKVLAVAAIFTGLEMIDSTQDRWLMKVMGGLVGWEALFYILLDGHLKWKANSADSLGSKLTTVDGMLMALFFLGNITFVVSLLVGIGMS